MLHIDLFPSLSAIPVNLQMHTQRNLIAISHAQSIVHEEPLEIARDIQLLPALLYVRHNKSVATPCLSQHCNGFFSAAAWSHTTKTAPSIAFLAVVRNCSQAARRWHRIRTSHGVSPPRAKYAVMLMQPMNKERPMLHAMPIFHTSFKRSPRHPSHLTFS